MALGTSMCLALRAAYGRAKGLSCPFVEPSVSRSNRSLGANTNEKAPKGGFFICIWRRVRDSNPRWAFDPYTLSRGAPSTTRPTLRRRTCQGSACEGKDLRSVKAGKNTGRGPAGKGPINEWAGLDRFRTSRAGSGGPPHPRTGSCKKLR